MALDLELKTLGVWTSYITELQHESLTVDQTGDGLNSTCSFDLIDRDVFRDDAWTVGVTHITDDGHVITGHIAFAEPKVEVRVTDGATVYFAGILSRADYKHFGKRDMIIHCDCHDFTQMLEESVVDDLEVYGAKTDEQIIDDIFPKYVTGIDKDLHVDGPFLTDEITFENVTVRRVLDTLAAKSNYKWYVDYSKKLHYDAAGALDGPAWHLSDRPDGVNSFSFFDDISMELDATNLVNMVFIVGAEVALWFQDVDSKAQYGEHKAILRDTNLIDIEDMEDKAEAVLAKHKDPVVTYRVKTYKDDLRAGMNVRLVCALYDIDDTFLINSLTVTFPVDGAPVYEIVCGGLRSSSGAAARRLGLDTLTDPTPIPPGQLPIASRGWGHDLTFTSVDHETVEWGAGTLTTAGGQEFAIAAGDTDDPGAMTEKTIVYLDTSISITELRMTTAETAALGINKIMVAVCWLGSADAGEGEIKAGFQVFGSTTEVATYLNATNVVTNSLTANEIYGNSLEVIAANIGVLTIEAAGEIRAYTGVWDANADGFRITHDEIAGQDNGVDQVLLTRADGKLKAGGAGLPVVIDAAGITITGGKFSMVTAGAGNPRIEITSTKIVGYDAANDEQFELKATDGKAYAGAGAVVLDENGIWLVGDGAAGNPRKVRFMDDSAGTKHMGEVYADWAGGAALATTWLMSRRVAGDPWPVNNQVSIGAVDSVAATDFRLTLGGANQRISITGGYLHVSDDIICTGLISTDNGAFNWELGPEAAGVAANCSVKIWINGTRYYLLARQQ